MQIRGKAYWTKLDKPIANYNKSKKIMKDNQPDGWGDEWSIEVANLSADTKKALKKDLVIKYKCLYLLYNNLE